VGLFVKGDTDAAVISRQEGGILSASLTIPRRYSHSPVEVLNINDCVASLKIIRQFIEDMGSFENLNFEDMD